MNIGMRYAVWSPITQEVRNQPIIYGTGVVVGQAISATLNWERNNISVDADDTEVHSDNSIVGGSLQFGLAQVYKEARIAMFGDTYDAEKENEWEDNAESAPYGGYGFVVGKKDTKTNTTIYEAMWLHKTQFGQDSENYQTKSRNGTVNTPTINGRIMGVYNDTTGKPRVRRHAEFKTPAEAIAWLNEIGNVPANENAVQAAQE